MILCRSFRNLVVNQALSLKIFIGYRYNLRKSAEIYLQAVCVYHNVLNISLTIQKGKGTIISFLSFFNMQNFSYCIMI